MKQRHHTQIWASPCNPKNGNWNSGGPSFKELRWVWCWKKVFHWGYQFIGKSVIDIIPRLDILLCKPFGKMQTKSFNIMALKEKLSKQPNKSEKLYLSQCIFLWCSCTMYFFWCSCTNSQINQKNYTFLAVYYFDVHICTMYSFRCSCRSSQIDQKNDTFLNVYYFDVHVQCTFFLFVIQIQAMVMNWPFINKYVICSEELIT